MRTYVCMCTPRLQHTYVHTYHIFHSTDVSLCMHISRGDDWALSLRVSRCGGYVHVSPSTVCKFVRTHTHLLACLLYVLMFHYGCHTYTVQGCVSGKHAVNIPCSVRVLPFRQVQHHKGYMLWPDSHVPPSLAPQLHSRGELIT